MWLSETEKRAIKACEHVRSIGESSVVVGPGCRHYGIVIGTLLADAETCLRCRKEKCHGEKGNL